jgi:hypothetical protein
MCVLRRRTGVIALVVASMLIVAVASASAGAPRLRLGLYSCLAPYAANGGNVELMQHGKYQYAYDRTGARLKSPATGRYRVTGRTLHWLSGTLEREHLYGAIEPANSDNRYPYLALNRSKDHVWTGISCYYLPHP